MTSEKLIRDPELCYCGGTRTYQICKMPTDFLVFKVPLLAKQYPTYKMTVCDNCGNVQVNMIR